MFLALHYLKHCGYQKIFPNAFIYPHPRLSAMNNVCMPTGRIVRDPPADQFVRVLTFDEARSLVSMDTEAPINIRFNSTEPRPQGQFLICYGLEESPNHGPTNENNSRIIRTDDNDQHF